MIIEIDKNSCAGFPDVGTIVIGYSMESGVRNGKQFKGTFREAYLPDNAEGREVLNLLILAFIRKLIFTVGRSVTT
jgi:deltex-like protein